MTQINMIQGKIYFLKFGSTEVVGRYKSSDASNYYFFDCLHNWSGFETFRADTHTVQHGIDEMREATQTEKQSLLRHSISNNTI